MHLFGFGALLAVEAGAREMEVIMRARNRASRQAPDRELPAVDLPDGERVAALEREATRRWLKGRA
jgi:hypothetical protein